MEAPERKRLKPTYQPPPPLPGAQQQALPPGWTEHTAPTGHKYYYNASTKKSTYVRPAAAPAPPAEQLPTPAFSPSPAPGTNAPTQGYAAPQDYAALAQAAHPHAYQNAYIGHTPNQHYNPAPFAQHQDFIRRPQHQRRPPLEDRPKRKAVIPNCTPWILVYTKLGRRFVHNPTTQESFWKFPPDVMTAVVEYDRQELEKKLAAKDEGTGANNVPVGNNNNRRRRSQSLQREDEAALAAMALEDDQEEDEGKVVPAQPANPANPDGQDSDSSEYEEVEVTDDEEEDGDGNEPGHRFQHPTNDTANPADEGAPVEFGEDDIAFQLAQMGEQYGLDPGEYDDGTTAAEDWEEGAEGLPLSDADTYALFTDLLTDHQISPFAPWEPLLENTPLISDERWTILPTTKARKQAWDTWTRDTISKLKLARAQQEKLDPKIPYLALLSRSATPKLYWPEFKRKFKRDPALALSTSKFGDREKEKLYRDFVARLKLPERSRKDDLVGLLKSTPLKYLNRDSLVENLHPSLLADVRFYGLPEKMRDGLVRAHISTLGRPAADTADGDGDEDAVTEAEREKRTRREAALRERERAVLEKKRRAERDVGVSRSRLREGEREIEEAMRVGRGGLRAQLGGGDGDDDVPAEGKETN